MRGREEGREWVRERERDKGREIETEREGEREREKERGRGRDGERGIKIGLEYGDNITNYLQFWSWQKMYLTMTIKPYLYCPTSISSQPQTRHASLSVTMSRPQARHVLSLESESLPDAWVPTSQPTEVTMDLVLSIYSVAKTLCEMKYSTYEPSWSWNHARYTLYTPGPVMLASRLAYNAVTISPLSWVPYLTGDFPHHDL
jgi:hypothetical protein